VIRILSAIIYEPGWRLTSRWVFLTFILLASPACAGELADCIYDRELEYATNSEPASWLSGIHAFALMMKVCIGDRDPTGVELSEIQDGMNRALAKAVELSKDRGEGT